MKKNRLLSILLALVLALSLIPVAAVPAQAATVNDVAAFKNAWNGKKASLGGTQCVALFNQYLVDVFGVDWTKYRIAYAYQLYDCDYSSLGWSKLAAGNYQVGDIVVWKAWGTKYNTTNNTAGHVAIVTSVGNGVEIIDQGNSYNVRPTSLFYPDSIRGVIRPKFDGAVSAGPALSPAKTQTVTPGKYILKNVGSGYTMNYAYTGMAGVSYKPIIMSKTDGSPEQTFDLQYKDNGEYVLAITHPDGGVVNVFRGSGTVQAGDPISQYSFSGSQYQRFYITPDRGGYVLQSVSDPNQVIAAPSTDWHAYLKLASYNQSDNKQVWTLEALDQPAAHTHDLTKTAATAATCTADGNQDYWTCSGCGKVFSDASGTTETTVADMTVKAMGHSYENGVCTRCGAADPNYTAPVTEPDPVVEPDPVAEPDPTPADIPQVHFEKQTIYFQGQFTDVAADQWFTKSVAAAFEYALMKGNSATTFNPYGDVTIAEAITMASRIHSIYSTGGESFVQTGDKWYQVYLDYAYQNGIISKAYYNCDVTQKATRAQFAEIFAKSLPDEGLYPINAIGENAVPDVKSSESYAPYVYKLYRAGILTGGDARGTFSPGTYITRAESAAIVSRMAESNNRVAFTLN